MTTSIGANSAQTTPESRPQSVRDLKRANISVLSASCLLESIVSGFTMPGDIENHIVVIRQALRDALADLDQGGPS